MELERKNVARNSILEGFEYILGESLGFYKPGPPGHDGTKNQKANVVTRAWTWRLLISFVGRRCQLKASADLRIRAIFQY